jgi:maltodextrin utilization protein YvdJ
MSELINKDIVDLQDIEKVQFLQTLQADPARYNAYVNEKSDRILSETVDTKRAAFVKMSGDMARMVDMDHNSIAALNRTNDLMMTQKHIISEQERQVSSKEVNKDMTRRQVEINNWYYENKRETLFVLQLLLLVVLTLVVVLGCTSYGWITQTAADYLMGFVIVVGACTWMYRYYYTTAIRDPR